MKTLKDLNTSELSNFNHLIETRNNFYNQGNLEKAILVQKDIDKLMKK